MRIAISVLAGLLWGGAAALLNAQISRRAIRKNEAKALMSVNFLRMGVDVAALGLVVLLRRILPFPYEPMLVAAAVAMSLVTIVFAYKLSADLQRQTPPEKQEEE